MTETPANPLLRLGSALLGLSLICIAAICLYNGSFAGPREPVPAGWPLRSVLVDLNIAILAGAGVALLGTRWQRTAALTVAAYLMLWTVVLHLPKVFAGEIAAWLGAAECLALAVAAAWLACWPEADRIKARALDAGFAICLFAFGAAHFIYADITASMVPSFLPAHHFFALFTGAAHIAAGLSLATGILTKWATRLLAIMFASFALLVNLPAALAKGELGPVALDLCFAAALTASAVILAATHGDRTAP
jgi:uncharacterized membrane protein